MSKAERKVKRKPEIKEVPSIVSSRSTTGLLSISQKQRVLVAEDDPISARLLVRTLESFGLDVRRAVDGREALEIFSAGDYRIVISDWMMPELHGVQLCQAIRAMNRPYVYLILLTSRGEKSDRAEAFDAGVDDMMAKPLDHDELVARLKVADRILKSEDRLQAQKTELEIAGEKLLIANQNLSVASKRFEDLFRKVPVACFTFDEQGLVHEWNHNAELMFQIPSHLSYQRPIWRVLGGHDDGIWGEPSVRVALAGRMVEAHEWTFTAGDGQQRYLVCNTFPLTGPNGEILGAISANVDITDRKNAERRIEDQKRQLEAANAALERLAFTDGLTGLRNHRSFHEELDRCVAGARQSSLPLSLAMIDVDNFKQYNDAFGHPAGDEVLKRVAELLQDACAEGQIVARYGGEEFAVVMPDTDADSALLAGEFVRQRVASEAWQQRPVTISIGISTCSDRACSPPALIAQADAALYASKAAGRNRVTHVRSLSRADLKADAA